MKENDIRPVSVLSGHEEAVNEDISRLLSRKNEFVKVLCPACLGSKYTQLFTKNGFEYVGCECGAAYLSPRPSNDVLAWFYRSSANYKYWAERIYPASENARLEHVIKPRVDGVLEICKKNNISTGTLLEIGCAYGTFCLEMQSRGVFESVIGVEPTPDLAEVSRAKGVQVYEGMIDDYAKDSVEMFDVIVAFEVIEHVFSPEEMLIKLAKILNPGGVLILTCPNFEGFDISMLGQLSTSIDHEHLNYFTPASMGKLFERCGFDPVDCFTPGKLDVEIVRKAVLAGEISLENNLFLQKILISERKDLGDAFQSFLSNNGLSSHMWSIAKLSVK